MPSKKTVARKTVAAVTRSRRSAAARQPATAQKKIKPRTSRKPLRSKTARRQPTSTPGVQPQPVRRRTGLAAWAQAQWQRLQAFGRQEPESLWFGVILLAGMVLRLLQPDWYFNRQFHPDERWIFGVVSQLSYPGEPSGLQYGTFPLYLLSLIKDFVAPLAGGFGHFDPNQFVIGAGRILSAVFDGGTLVLTYLLGRRLAPGAVGRRIGLLAAGFLAFSVLNIQMAHFFVVDVPLGMLTTGTLYWAVGIVQRGQRRDYVWAGVFLGLAMATKTSALPLAVAVAGAHLLGLNRVAGDRHPARWVDLGLAVAASLMAFFIAMPHAILDWSRFWANQNEQRRILVTGEADVPYNRQYWHTLPYLYYARNLIRYGLGAPLGLAAILAFLFYPVWGAVALVRGLVLRAWKRLKTGLDRHAEWIVVLSFGVAYSVIIGSSFAKFNRYLLPLTPVLCLAAAKLAADVMNRTQTQWQQRAVRLTSAAVFGLTLLWSLAFVSIYQAEHPWIAASRWMLENVPAMTSTQGSLRYTAVLNEEWGDDLPVHVQDVPARPYQNNKFAVQEPDTPRKREMILAMLQANDVIVMADTRAHAVYRRLAEQYPINAAYYQLMFDEQLGFELAAEFYNYPRLFGLVFADDAADESFTLYDHPHVYLFRRRTPQLDPAEMARRLDERISQIQAPRGDPPPAPARAGARPAPQATPLPTVINANVGQKQDQPVFILGRLNSLTAGLAWLLLAELIGLLAIPLCLSLFPRLPDSGVSLAKIIGSLVLTWVIWMGVSSGVLRHLQVTSLGVLVALGGASVVWGMKRRTELLEFYQQRGRYWLTAEVVFIVGFIFYLLVRAYNPDIHNPYGHGYNGGGEPMGMSFLSAVYYSVHFPPYDPWLSGYHINYYYFGQVILGIMAKLTGLPPAWAYNTAIAFLFALTLTGVYGLGLGLTGQRRWGMVAAMAALMAGNLHTLFYMLEPLNRGINLSDFTHSVGRWAAETWQHWGRFEFLWNPTRLIKGTINEMPWFSFLYGDLHAHIIAIPYSLPLIGWGLNVLLPSHSQTTLLPEAPGRTGTERGLSFFVTALTLGALSAINTWNFPPYALLVLGVLVIQALNGRTGRSIPWPALGQAVLGWLRLVVGGLALLFFFHRYFVPQSTSLAWVNPAVRTPLKDFLVFFALPVFLLVSFWAEQWIPQVKKKWQSFAAKAPKRASGWVRTAQSLKLGLARQPRLAYVAGTLLLGLLVLILFDQVLLAVLISLWLLNLYILVRLPLTPQLRMGSLLSWLGLSIVLGCEIVHVRDFMGVGGDMSRMNTVFKFYIIVWIFFSLALAAAGAHLFQAQKNFLAPLRQGKHAGVVAAATAGVLVLWATANYYQANTGFPWLSLALAACLLGVPWARFAWPRWLEWRVAWVAVLAAMVLVVSLYAPVSLYNRLRLCSGFRHPTLNGIAYLNKLLPQEAAALDWINREVERNDIILEAPGRQGYNCFDTRVAIFTGHASLIGWVGQEEQMRYNNELTGSRTRDADRIYTTTDETLARRLLEQYHVRYVFVGENERKAYPARGLEKFARMMDVAYQDQTVMIFRVRPH